MSHTRYRPYPKVDLPDRTWPDNVITAAPRWCSVDLRDGNQALHIPMGIEQKLTMFKALVAVGFKEIEIGFPSASQVEFDFARRLIDEGHVPADVTLQVLVQARQHLIERTFEALDGAHSAIVHVYNSTSTLQREVVFGKDREAIKAIAVAGASMHEDLKSKANIKNLTFQYSPESFTGTELDFALDVCHAVVDVWQPTPEHKCILNLPATVEMSTPTSMPIKSNGCAAI